MTEISGLLVQNSLDSFGVSARVKDASPHHAWFLGQES